MKVELTVPDEVRLQLVFRQRRYETFPAAAMRDVEFILLDCPLKMRRWLGPLFRSMGLVGFVKAAVKLAGGRRLLYAAVRGGRLAHFGWLTLDGCRHYWVDPGSVVIGPIWTAPSERRRGLATEAVRRTMNAMVGRRRSVFYIDTSDENLASQRVIAKCGFGPPVAAYVRGLRSAEEGRAPNA